MSRWLLEWLRRPGRTQVVAGLDGLGMVWQVNGAAPLSASIAMEASVLRQQVGPHAHVDVICADDVAVHWLQASPPGVQSLGELRQVAAARCAHLFGGSPTGWWVTGDWSATRPFVCAGLPMERVEPLRRALTDAAASARWHTAWGLLCSAQARSIPAEGWSAVRNAARVLLWHCRQGQVTALHAINLGPQTGAAQADDAVAQLLRIEALRDPALAPGQVHWVQRPEPAPAWPDGGAAIALAAAPWLPGA